MKTKIALLIVYNHRYDKNIPRLENIYKDRFSYVYHLVPFYDGVQKNVIPVYESSYYFQSYIAQAYTHINKEGFTHFFIVADDMIINPSLNEGNLHEKLGLQQDECYLPRTIILQEKYNFKGKRWWGYTQKAVGYSIEQRGVEVKSILPSVHEAQKILEQFGIPFCDIPITTITPKTKVGMKLAWDCIKKKCKLYYPLVGGYVDTFIVTADVMPKFCQYCGAFSATKLFVEIAIPTALFLSATKIKMDKDVKLHEGDLWNDDQIALCKKYGYDLDKLLESYPQNVLFIHPVKLSKWKSSRF